jgi:8-oxo-dGTP pyrophosphatase MutT (NUDIX family)
METAKIKIGKVDSEPVGSFSAAFVLPITRDGRVLLTKEKRGQIIKYGMLGGVARSDETDFQCMSREAKEETGGALSLITLARIADGRGILDRSKVHYENSKSFAVKHDLVVASDLDIDSRFEPAKVASMRTGRATIAKKKCKAKAKAATVQLGIEFVPIANVRDWEWRSRKMHHNPSVLCARLMKLGE